MPKHTDAMTRSQVDYYSGQGFYDNVQSQASSNNSNIINMDYSKIAEALQALGSTAANAQLAATNSSNALSKYMWEQGEANTDRRLQQQMDFTAQQAQTAMDYQTQMSNTAHQREVQDLIAAGLNPVLSANNGASTPSGLMGGASAVGANGFSAQQSNIVGAYSAAGEFISNILALQQDLKIYNKEYNYRSATRTLDSLDTMFGGVLSSLTSGLLGNGNRKGKNK